jgi:hypothetical protein
LEQRRLRLLNARGHEAREVLIAIHQTNLAVSLDRPPKGRGKDAGKGVGSSDPLRFAILVGYGGEQERQRGRTMKRVGLRASFRRLQLRSSTSAEVSYRESCIRQFEWRVMLGSDRHEAYAETPGPGQ